MAADRITIAYSIFSDKNNCMKDKKIIAESQVHSGGNESKKTGKRLIFKIETLISTSSTNDFISFSFI